jgi:FkbM family methyltransferase
MKSIIVKTLHSFLKISVFEKIYVFLLSQYPNSFLLKFAPLNNEYKQGESVRFIKRNNINYKLDLYDYMQWSLYFYNNNDSSLNLLKYINTNDVVFDIGGNIGQTSLNIAKKIGNYGKVYCFEPYPENFEALKTNISLNKNINNLIIENLGLGQFESSMKMYKNCIHNSGGNRIISNLQNEKFQELVDVEIKTIDNYCKENNINNIDVIKIDVEGFELFVLNGAIHTLQNLSPKLYIELCENNLKEHGSTPQDIIDYLSKFNYNIFDSITNKQIKFHSELSNNCLDIYCVKNI